MQPAAFGLASSACLARPPFDPAVPHRHFAAASRTEPGERADEQRAPPEHQVEARAARERRSEPDRSTASPPSSAPSGIDAATPAVVAPNTRARMPSGTSPYIAVAIIGFSAPAARPDSASTGSSTGSGAPSAIARYGGAPASTKHVANISRPE